MFIPLFVLILRDKRVWPWDEAYYGEYAVSLFRTLRHSPLDWPGAMTHALGDRPPAIVWIGQFFVPLAPALPLMQSALLLCTLVTQVISILLLYRALLKIFSQSLPSLLTACLVAAGPLFVGMTYRFFVEPLQGLSVVWVLVLAAFHDRLDKTTVFLHLAAAVAAGLLVKTSTPLYQLPMLLYLGFVLVRRSSFSFAPTAVGNSRRHLYVVAAVVILLIAGTSTWYIVNYQATIKHLVDAASGEIALFYGSQGNIYTKLVYWTTQFQRSYFWLPVLLFAVLMIVSTVFTRRRQAPALTKADLFALGSAVWIIVVLIIFSRNINEDSRYLLGMFPYLGCVVCWLLANMRSRGVLMAFGALCFAQFVIVTGQAFGAIAPRNQLSAYLQPYVRDDRALRDVMSCAANTADASLEQGIFVGEELPEFNGNAIAFYRRVLGFARPSFGNLQIFNEEIDAQEQWLRVRESGCRYYVYRLDPSIGGDRFNRLAKAVFERVSMSPDFRLRPDKSTDRMLIFENVRNGLGDSALKEKHNLFQGVNPEGRSPFGLLEFPKLESPEQKYGTLPASGWVVSPTGIARVEVLVDGQKTANTTLQVRANLKKAYPSFQSASFSTKIDTTSLTEGIHEVSAVAYDDQGSSRVLAKVQIVLSVPEGYQGVNPVNKLPFGLVESPNRADRHGGEIFPVFGWVVSPSGVDRIEVLVDGKHAADAPPQARPDVVRAYPSIPSAGFYVEVATDSVPEGLRQVSVVAYGKNGSSRVVAQIPMFLHALQGFQGVNPKDQLPFGLVESPKVGVRQNSKTLPVFGWAVFPSGIRRIEIQLDGKPVAEAPTKTRADVVKAYPSAPSAGFYVELNTSSVPKGRHQLTVIAQSKDGSSRVLAQIPILEG